MNRNDIELLQNIGLTHAQAVIYLILLELGQSKVGEIIKKTNLQSSVVHNNVNKLIEKGLVTFVLIGKIKHYNAAEPDVFTGFVQEQKNVLDKKLKTIKKSLPKLKSIKSQAKKSSAEIYEGRKGFKTAFMESYFNTRKGSEAPFISQPKEFQKDEKLHNLFLQLDTIAKDKKLILKGLAPKESKKEWEKLYTTKKTYKVKFTVEVFPWGLMIFKDHVLISMWGDEPITIKINDSKFRNKALKFFRKKWKMNHT